MEAKTLVQELKQFGVASFGTKVWEKDGEAPKYAGVKGKINASSFGSSLIIGDEGAERVFVKLAKNVPANKESYDIFVYKAVRDFTPDAAQLAKYPNTKSIKAGQLTVMAH